MYHCHTPLIWYSRNDLYRQVSNVFKGKCNTHVGGAGSGEIKLEGFESCSLNKSNYRKGALYSDQFTGC